VPFDQNRIAYESVEMVAAWPGRVSTRTMSCYGRDWIWFVVEFTSDEAARKVDPVNVVLLGVHVSIPTMYLPHQRPCMGRMGGKGNIRDLTNVIAHGVQETARNVLWFEITLDLALSEDFAKRAGDRRRFEPDLAVIRTVYSQVGLGPESDGKKGKRKGDEQISPTSMSTLPLFPRSESSSISVDEREISSALKPIIKDIGGENSQTNHRMTVLRSRCSRAPRASRLRDSFRSRAQTCRHGRL
jgi:hypothetical protein